jgi:hypothetical protein
MSKPETLSNPQNQETGSQAEEFVKWHLENAPQPWTRSHAKSYLRSLVERDIYRKLCSVEQLLKTVSLSPDVTKTSV